MRVADNIAALAAHIDALRRIERYGVATIEQALAGYKALPADTAADWRSVFGFSKDSRPTLEQVDSAFKKWAREKHPDTGGSDIEMAHLNRARDYAPKQSIQKTRPSKEELDRRFRQAVWQLEGGRSRVTGQMLYHVHESDLLRGQVCHLRGRGAHPAHKFNPSNAILMSDHHHRLSDHRGGRLLRLTQDGESATDATRPITFTLYDRAGQILWQRTTSRVSYT